MKLLKLHSVVDLITNSSTVIFTYSKNSVEAVKQLINEMCKVFDSTLTADDLFYFGVFCDDTDVYTEYIDSVNEDEDPSTHIDENINIDQLIEQIMRGELEKPQWMIDAEKDESYSGCYTPSTELRIIPKNEQYSELANKLLKYLYSTDHEATRDG